MFSWWYFSSQFSLLFSLQDCKRLLSSSQLLLQQEDEVAKKVQSNIWISRSHHHSNTIFIIHRFSGKKSIKEGNVFFCTLFSCHWKWIELKKLRKKRWKVHREEDEAASKTRQEDGLPLKSVEKSKKRDSFWTRVATIFYSWLGKYPTDFTSSTLCRLLVSCESKSEGI